MKNVSFSDIVSGAEPVTGAFENCPTAKAWWRAILWLHGKPTAPELDGNERNHILANGFRFYAQLYAFLGSLFWLVGLAAWRAGVFETSNDAFYWFGAALLAGLFLLMVSSVSFAGAKSLRHNHPAARLMLCAFMVGIMCFLSGLVVMLSAAVHFQSTVGTIVNLATVTMLWIFGIGSYMIEVLYLVADK